MTGYDVMVAITTTLTLLMVVKVTEVGGCPKCQMCMFPKTMYDVTRPWRMFSKDDDIDIDHDSRRVTFKETFMYVTYLKELETVHEVRYTCKQDKGANKYWALKRFTQGGDAGQYTCVQFVFRATNVVQLRIAAVTSDKSAEVCSDSRLQLMDAPLIYYGTPHFWKEDRNQDAQYNECPLKGGFVVTWTDHEGNEHCNNIAQTTKLESECSQGEGISFVNLAGYCAPPPLKHINLTHRYYCMAHWQDNFYTYMVLYAYYGGTPMPCMRFPTNHGDEFNAVIFLDGSCRTEPDVSHVETALVLNLRRKVADDICADLSPDCDGLAMNQCGDDETRVCRKTCSLCPRRTRPWEDLEFSPYLRGEWRRDTEQIGRELVTIDTNTINIPSLGSFRYMGNSHCLTGRSGYAQFREYSLEESKSYPLSFRPFMLKNKDHSKTAWLDEGNEDVLLLSTYSNGCSPRLMNVGFYNRSESVVSYRNGFSIPAIIKENMGSHIHEERYVEFTDRTLLKICSTSDLIVDIYPLGDRYIPSVQDWYTLVRNGEEAPTVPCNIPENDPGEWSTLRVGEGSFPGKYDGTYAVRMEPHSPETEDSFTVHFKNCYLQKKDKSRAVFNNSFTMAFTCLGIAEDNYYDDACVFTRTTPNEIIDLDYVSWIIQDYKDKTYLYYVGACAHWTSLSIEKDQPEKRAIATLSFQRYASTATTIVCEHFLVLLSLFIERMTMSH